MKPSLLFGFCLCLTVGPLVAADKGVDIQRPDNAHLTITIDGKPLGTLNHGASWNKPFLYPLTAPDGTNVLRDIIPTKAEQGSSKDGTDHFHHKGVWVSVDSVNDERLNFWHEADIIRCRDVTSSVQNGVGIITLKNDWMQGEKPLLKETTTIVIYPSRLLSYHIHVQAVDKDVTFHDTKEGFFAVRIAHTMRQMQGGHIVNAAGLTGEKDCWGKPSPWIDYYGEVDGATCGVTLMDHPDNFRESRYHVRGYGLFSISPFGPRKYSNNKEPAAPVTLKPDGDGLHLTYGLFVHNGDTDSANVADAYQQFLKVNSH